MVLESIPLVCIRNVLVYQIPQFLTKPEITTSKLGSHNGPRIHEYHQELHRFMKNRVKRW
ncbi:AIG_G0004850.mRNA.1.CDS.1 [Saccharomyces cerevisiae]|nr:AIG_G0004850.mRNA.1.CDS.1 [Saccharomyces cerevisiae]CAI6511738.1 AIG_G0004850.mRNA.1.CDS.1 [Saccharomyces cerevisiae]